MISCRLSTSSANKIGYESFLSEPAIICSERPFLFKLLQVLDVYVHFSSKKPCKHAFAPGSRSDRACPRTNAISL
ncbi:hypothetical protein RvY_04728 [Ramazzottius varieornatus]|uniref:Uncharacterized protein n=1 Tax=Ramazzottius varieornatus TaxID=947166 RepID=A0A1D1USM9_RAMVA|nr:hypothetical protein RvY_04728 [Ramazzottius varieornatus]